MVRPIAIYLPQFHPIPENDQWWGKGFTEWTNVARAKPMFNGHYQPHLPADLGFYDLRVPEVRDEQARLASEHGIYGFCYYHYWFNGRRVLERPFQEIYESGKPDFPFMLCWANENWTRTWDGLDKEVLLEQNYSEEDDRNHIRSLIPFFKDKRYIKVNGRPVIAIYKSMLLPNPKNTTDTWREEAKKQGLDLYICRFENFSITGEDYLKAGGFDAGVDFQPFGHYLDDFTGGLFEQHKRQLGKRIYEKLFRTVLKAANRAAYEQHVKHRWKKLDYGEYVKFIKTRPLPAHKVFPGITPMWDNTARKKENYFLFKNATPALYGQWLRHIVDNFRPKSPEENFVFINAWNEWAEGNHLEPCQRWGRQYLEVTKKVLCGQPAVEK